MEFTVCLAGVKIGITSIYDEVFNMCKNYLCDGKGEFSFAVTQDDIEFEREKSLREAAIEHIAPYQWTNSYLETLAVYRKIAVSLLEHNTFLMHGSAVCVNGLAYLFSAQSGVGKTTHTRLWLQNVPGVLVINGDKPLIRVEDNCCRVFGSPWAGKEAMNNNTSARLRAICFLERGENNHIEKVGFSDCLSDMIQQTYRPSAGGDLAKTLELIKQVGQKTDFYRLSCNMKPEAATVAYGGMKP